MGEFLDAIGKPAFEEAPVIGWRLGLGWSATAS
jgi:hypothetical protein